MIEPRFYSKWHKLTDVMLGTTYPHEYYDGLPDAIRDPLLQLTDETLEDLDYFDSVLKQFGCNVIRPELEKSSIKEWIDQNKINEEQITDGLIRVLREKIQSGIIRLPDSRT